jgi:hypothetical protein
MDARHSPEAAKMRDLLRSALIFLLAFAGLMAAELLVWQLARVQPSDLNCRTMPAGSWDCRPSNVKEIPK